MHKLYWLMLLKGGCVNMETKAYETPVAEVFALEAQDVVRTSGESGGGSGSGGNELPIIPIE